MSDAERKRARQLRRAATPEETRLWEELRGTKLGIPIRRQHPIGTVIVDFYCPRAKVAIELDGAHHKPAADALRDQKLLQEGVVVVRFENFRVVTAIRDLVHSRAAVREADKSA